MNPVLSATLALWGSMLIASPASAAQMPLEQPMPNRGTQDSRQEVNFPPLAKRHTLMTMRMHLQGLAEIQGALAAGKFEEAAHIATETLGMSSMHGNQMAEDSKYMPQGMMRLGALMHQRAEEFAVSAQNAAATGDVRPPLRALSNLTQTCVACHAVYRLR